MLGLLGNQPVRRLQPPLMNEKGKPVPADAIQEIGASQPHGSIFGIYFATHQTPTVRGLYKLVDFCEWTASPLDNRFHKKSFPLSRPQPPI